MESSEYLGIGGLIIAAISLITGFILQRDSRKVRDLERTNKKMKYALDHSLSALDGYENIENQLAQKEGKTLTNYRTKVREEYKVKEYRFLTPSDIKEYKNIEE
jgi:hypothetical protein